MWTKSPKGKASGVTNIVDFHHEAMSDAAELEVGESYAIGPLAAFSLTLLVEIATDYCVGKRCIVVFAHEDHDCYEVIRTMDGTKPQRYYNNVVVPSKSQKPIVSTGKYALQEKRIIESFVELLDPSCSESYGDNDPKMRHYNVASYSALHRKSANHAMFRKEQEGPTKAIKQTIGRLVEAGTIKELERDQCRSIFKTTAALYQLGYGIVPHMPDPLPIMELGEPGSKPVGVTPQPAPPPSRLRRSIEGVVSPWRGREPL